MFEATHARGAALGRGGRGRRACASTTRTGWPTRAATSGGCARRRRTAGWWWRRSSRRARRCRRPGRSTAPPATTRCARSAACSSTRRARPCSPQLAASTPDVPRRRGDAQPPADHRPIAGGRGAPDRRARRRARRSRGAVAELMVAFPVYRSYLPGGPRALDRPRSTGRARPGPTSPTRCPRWTGRCARTRTASWPPGSSRPPAWSWPRASRTPRSTGGPGSSRSTRSAARRTGSASRPPSSTRRAAAREAGWPATMTTLSTHDTKRVGGRAGPARGARRAGPRSAPTAVRRWSARAPARRSRRWSCWPGRRWSAPGRSRPTGCAAYLDKAAQGGQAPHVVGRPRRGVRGRRSPPGRPRCSATPSWPRTSRRSSSGSRPPGWSNSLGRSCCSSPGPGVPDVYQGTELWDLSLVDPDNRRPVDFAAAPELLARLDDGWLPEVDDTGAAKLLVRTTLRLRRERPELFTGYRPLPRRRARRRRTCVAFARGRRGRGGHPAAGRPGPHAAGRTRSCRCPTRRLDRRPHRPPRPARSSPWPTCSTATRSRCWCEEPA